MSRRWLLLASLAIALPVGGCGGEAHEDAPAIGTAAAIAKAPPGATGADVGRPAAPSAFKAPTPIKKGGPGLPPKPTEPLDPTPLPQGAGGAPPKGTDL